MEWKIKQEETVSTRRFNIVEQEVELPNGDPLHFSYVKINHGVCILALTEEGEVLCLKQYRHAIGSWEWELPAGGVEKGEEPLKTAQRELIEETGYAANEWKALGLVYPSPGSTDEHIHLFLATDLVPDEQQLESGEQIEVFKTPLDGLYDLVRKGAFNHGAGLAAIARYAVR